MDIPKGIKNKGRISTTYVLNIFKNLYGQRKVSMVYNQYIIKVLDKIPGWITASSIDTKSSSLSMWTTESSLGPAKKILVKQYSM